MLSINYAHIDMILKRFLERNKKGKMREILFRGKALDNNWYYGVPLVFTEDYVCMTAPHTYNKSVIPETVGQYTGLTDKNGTKIFEGDIVEIEEHGYIPTKYKGFVVLKNGCFGVEYNYRVIFYEKSLFHRFGHIEHWQEMGASGTITYSYEVIGNIHDNPELFSK